MTGIVFLGLTKTLGKQMVVFDSGFTVRRSSKDADATWPVFAKIVLRAKQLWGIQYHISLLQLRHYIVIFFKHLFALADTINRLSGIQREQFFLTGK